MLPHVYAAMAGFDYTSISIGQVFASGSANGTMRCVNICVQDDEALEGNQTFAVVLSTSDSNVVLGTDVTVVSIIDNDGMNINKLQCIEIEIPNEI